MIKIVCTGGGSREAEQPLHEIYAGWLGSSAKVLYWPIAMDGSGPTYPEALAWVSDSLRPLGVENITMWTELESHRPAELCAFDGIWIGGGNTFRLLRQIRKQGFFDTLRKFIGEGHPAYGGSAGALIMGHNMLTTHDTDDLPSETFDRQGLNFLSGFSMWCHYQEFEDTAIHAYVKRNNVPVIAYSEKSGVVVEKGRMRIRGLEGAQYFWKGQKSLLALGQEVPGL